MLSPFTLLQIRHLILFQSQVLICAEVCKYAYSVDLPVQTYLPINHTIENVTIEKCAQQCCSMRARCTAFSMTEPDVCTSYRYILEVKNAPSPDELLFVRLELTNETEAEVCSNVIKYAVKGIYFTFSFQLHTHYHFGL